MAQEASRRGGAAARDREGSGPPGPRETRWTWLLILPLLGTLFPPIYNHSDPHFIGMPFFYWYQMVWIPLSVICTVLVYRATRRGRRS